MNLICLRWQTGLLRQYPVTLIDVYGRIEQIGADSVIIYFYRNEELHSHARYNVSHTTHD
jgi:hypothetical protein